MKTKRCYRCSQERPVSMFSVESGFHLPHLAGIYKWPGNHNEKQAMLQVLR